MSETKLKKLLDLSVYFEVESGPHDSEEDSIAFDISKSREELVEDFRTLLSKLGHS